MNSSGVCNYGKRQVKLNQRESQNFVSDNRSETKAGRVMTESGKRQRVLIVEDEPDLSSLMARILKGHKNIKPIVKTSGKEALRLLEIAKTPIDILLLDLRLPDMNGLEVLKRFRTLGNNPDGLRIMVVTAFGSPEVREEAFRLGADSFVDKPLQLETLLDFVTNRKGGNDLAHSNFTN